MRSLRLNIFIALSLALGACDKPLPQLTGIDLAIWKTDKNGCNGKRADVLKSLQEQKNKLQGLSEMQILELLGRPDQNELYKRNQKFYYYWLEPGKACGQNAESRKLSVRFNAMGLAKEIVVR
jgi:hypothetical protein